DQIGTAEDEEEPVFASLRKGQMIETITLEEPLELFKLPKKVGGLEGRETTVAIGRFGPYIRHKSSFYSLPNGLDPLDVEQDQASQISEEKRQKDKDKIIKIFDENPEAKIENGRWGPFVRFGKQNLKIPKGVEVEKITYADVLKWAEEDSKSPSAKK